MAQKQTIQFIDDLDGKVLEEFETIRWAVDGKEYEFDTSPKNAQQFRNAVDKYLAVSRKVSGTKQSRSNATPRPATKTGKEQTQSIRAWAKSEGYEISGRGRIPAGIVEAFEAAH